MKQMTIRGIPPDVERIVRKEAETKGTSLNKAFLSLVEKGAGVKGEARKKTSYRDLDRLSGVWTAKDASAFEKTLGAQRKVDDELWKRGA